MTDQLPNRAALATLLPDGAVCAELGVAKGDFSYALLRDNPKIARLWAIDRWGDHHDAKEMDRAIARLSLFNERGLVVNATFEVAAGAFPDGHFDFVYVDGYAHTGQEGGATLRQWWPLVKPGGVFAGHDYSPRWQPTIDAVDAFVKEHNLELNLTAKGEGADRFPSWWVRKPCAP